MALPWLQLTNAIKDNFGFFFNRMQCHRQRL